MQEYYDIAVVGESMAGKSTWIASLFREDIAKELRTFSHQNREGQTKIPVYYRLQSPGENDFHVVDIKWNPEQLAKVFDKGRCPKSLERFMLSLKMPCQFAAATEDDAVLSDELRDYLQTEEYKACLRAQDPFYLLSQVINNEEIGELGVISYVEVQGAASEKVWAEIEQYRVEGIRLRDTRGFVDKAESRMKEDLELSRRTAGQDCRVDMNPQTPVSEEEAKEQYLRRLLDDRGVYGIDACVFMSMAGANTLSKRSLKEIYGPLIRYMLERHPVFLTIRSDRLSDIYQSNPEIRYESVIEKNESGVFCHLGKNFMGFRDLRELLKEYGLSGKTEDYRTNLAQKHYCELLLADIPTGLSPGVIGIM